jgi:paraquat-inducible protein B
MTAEELPRAKVRRRRLFRIVWVVPIAALAVAGWLVYQHLRTIGPEITISFIDGGGIRVGQTQVRYRGVSVGEVSGVQLSPDHQHVLVRARLVRSAASLARDGARFWIVRPELGWGNITGLRTVFSGPEIQVLPGEGEPKAAFTALESAPVGLQTPGLRVVLRAARPIGLRTNSPVYYRGVEVGVVQMIDLAPNAISADVHVLVFERYRNLVRQGSTFWTMSGVVAKGSILKGIEVGVESMRVLVTGGIEFATPPNTARVKPGTVFFLYDEPKKEWLAWAPRLAIAAPNGP